MSAPATPEPASWLRRRVPGTARLAPRPARGVRAAAAWLGPPLIVFVLAQAAVIVAAIAHGANPWHAGTWSQYDSLHYLRLADNGARIFKCAGHTRIGETPPGGAPFDPWCGDAAWFVGYSAQIALAKLVGLPLIGSALAISISWSFATLVAVWLLLLDRKTTAPSLAALTFTGFIPGMIYTHNVFPMSGAMFFLVCFFGAIRRERWWWAALAGGIACTMHSAMTILVPVVVAWLLLQRGWTWRERLTRTVVIGGATGIGTAISPLVIALQTGVFDAYVKQRNSYGTAMQWPWERLREIIGPLVHANGLTLGNMAGVEAAFVAVMMVGLLAWSAWSGARDVESLAVLYLAVAWLYPLVAPQVTVTRTDTLLVPAVLLIRRLPAPWAWSIAAGSAALAAPIAKGFFAGTII